MVWSSLVQPLPIAEGNETGIAIKGVVGLDRMQPCAWRQFTFSAADIERLKRAAVQGSAREELKVGSG